MAFPLSAPNLTQMKIRKVAGSIYVRQYQIDPYWGIPAGGAPMSLDPNTGLVRPFSSYQTVATAVATFVGFTKETFVPGSAGATVPSTEQHSVWIDLAGWVEMILDTPQAIVAGDLFKPILVDAATDYVSNDTVEAADGPEDALAIFTAYKSCLCQPFFEPASCPGGVPVASDLSPTEALDRRLQRTVLLSWGV